MTTWRSVEAMDTARQRAAPPRGYNPTWIRVQTGKVSGTLAVMTYTDGAVASMRDRYGRECKAPKDLRLRW